MMTNVHVSDFGSAVSLSAIGFKLLDIKRKSGSKRAIFVFDIEEERAQTVIDSYWSGTLELPVLKVLQQSKYLKQRLYASNG